MKNSMPERPDMIEYTEKSQRNYVQKQKSLMLLQDSELPLSALKILDLYLSKLDNYLSKQLTRIIIGIIIPYTFIIISYRRVKISYLCTIIT